MILRRRQAVVVTLVVFIVVLATLSRRQDSIPWLPDRPPSQQEALVPRTLPELDRYTDPRTPLSDFCAQRFTARYLEDLRDHAMQYCGPGSGTGSAATLTCYHAHARDDGGVDSFCLGTGAVFRPEDRKFRLPCAVRAPDANETARGLIPLPRLVPYWQETGPRRLLEGFIDLSTSTGEANEAIEEDTSHAPLLLLVKREGNHNLWHGLMELWAMATSFDVLRISPDPASGSGPAFRFPEDLEHTQVVVVDDDPVEEANFALWRLFSAKPTVRLSDLAKDPAFSEQKHRLLLPLAGASNPLWQNDWTVRPDCRAPPTLGLFAERVLGYYGLTPKSGPLPGPNITLTFLDRRGTRKLRDSGVLLAALREKYPHVTVQVVDAAALSFPAQLRLMQETDILAGVHGAGLTHALFMREGAGAVVEIQPAGMGHVGFRNLAAMRGIKYFRAQAEMVGEETGEGGAEEGGELKEKATPHWQTSDVRMEEARFLALMDAAIKSVYNEGERRMDVV